MNFLNSLHRQLEEFINKSAGLQQDMANRVMYSLIPSLADPMQVALTEGVVDYRALRVAVEGRKKLIKYGVRAVANELEHAAPLKQRGKIRDRVESLINVGRLEEAMDVAIEAFKNDKLWNTGFGGLAWQKIAETLRQIIRLDSTLDKIRYNSRDNDPTHEVQVMRDIIVQMNIFDGLAHNSDDVMRNLVELERPSKYPSEKNKNYYQIRRIMDAKELDSVEDVFRMIRPTLEGSGDL